MIFSWKGGLQKIMKVKNIIQSISLILGFTFILLGCGGGGSSTSDPVPGSTSNPLPGKSDIFKFNRISIAGSSITHGNIEDGNNNGEGYLGEKSYVGYVESYFRENIADTIGPDDLNGENSVIETPMSYKGKLKLYNAGTKISATLKASDEIVIVFGGSDERTVVNMEVDGKNYGDFTIPTGNYLPVKKMSEDNGFYKAFRINNPQAVKSWKLDENKAHNFTLTVKEGTLKLNFITNHMYYFQNAGVGGYEAKDFLSEFREHSTYKDIVAFNPDLFIFESSTNDAKTWAVDAAGSEESTNRWIIENPESCNTDGKRVILTHNINVAPGDIVIFGNYIGDSGQGDIQNMVVGIIESASTGNSIQLSKYISYSGQRVHEVSALPQEIEKVCRIKNISMWENRVKELVQKIEDGVGHNVVVGIGTSGVPNYFEPPRPNPETPRRLLGYREKGEILAKENGWFFVDFFQNTLAVEPGVDYNHKWTYGDNTHPNEPGRTYFGQAVISALAPYLE